MTSTPAADCRPVATLLRSPRRVGRRRQVHPHRPAALRHQGDLRGPARGGGADEPRPRRRVHEPRAAHRRAARRARAGHHHRRGLPLLRHPRVASSSSPTHLGTSSTPATWSRARPPRTLRSSWSTPARVWSSKPVGKGTGLGLSAVYGVIQDHRGQITCQNNPQGGAVFLVRLPANIEPVANRWRWSLTSRSSSPYSVSRRSAPVP